MKKIVSVFLSLLMLTQLLCGLVISAEADTSATPRAATRVTTDIKQEIMADYAVATVPAEAEPIATAREFSAMTANKVYYLTADFTVTSTYTTTFKGTLYGNGHTITISNNKAVFNALENATIYDLTLAGSLSVSADNVGALAAQASNTTLVGVTNNATVKNTKTEKYAGGLLGHAANTTLKYCVNNGEVSGNTSASRVGGLVGQMEEANAFLTLENCINNGAVTGVNQVGGLVGRVQSGKAVTLKSCANFGTVTISTSDGAGLIGKVTGTSVEVTLVGCYNSGRIVGAKPTGGLFGYMDNLRTLTVTDCHNGCFVKNCSCKGSEHGYVTNKIARSEVGGVLAYVNAAAATITITNCTNSGKIVAGGSGGSGTDEGSRAGGVAGVIVGYQVTFKDCVNNAAVDSTYYLGGICSRVDACGELAQDNTGTSYYVGSKLLMENCANNGKLTSRSYIGGMIGFTEKSSEVIFKNCSNSGEIAASANAAGMLTSIDKNHTVGCTVELTDCSNSGKITGGGTSGGLVGYISNAYEVVKSLTLTDCINTGDVTSPNKVGGLVGDSNVRKFTATNCRNEGDINVANQNETACAGGIVGRTWGLSTFTECVNTGNVIEKKTGNSTAILYAGGIAGWCGREGTSYKDDVANFNGCISAATIIARSALNDKQALNAGGIVGICKSLCYANRCMVVGELNGNCHVAGISCNNGSNEISGSEFNTCVVAADLYNSGTKVTSRSQGTAGIAGYVWGAAHVSECVILGDLTLDIHTSDLAPDQRRPLSALVGYSNNGGGSYKNNFFGGQLIAGEGTDCIVVMVAYTVEADVTGDVGYDICDNYSYYEYPLFYWGYTKNNILFGGEYSEYTTPTLTEEQIAEGISLADLVMESNPTLKAVVTCTGIEVPMLSYMISDYEWALELTGGHGYVDGCFPNCGICGKVRVELHHTYRNDCDTDCNACGFEREVGDHDFGPWITLKPATETETGLRKSTCQTCGFEETFTVPVLTHKDEEEDNGSDSVNNGNADADADAGSFSSFVKNNLVIVAAAGGGVLLVVIIVIVLLVKKSSKKKENDNENVEF